MPNDSTNTLIRRRIDGLLSPDELAEFDRLLATDEEFAKRYVQCVDLEAALYEKMTVPTARTALLSKRKPAFARFASVTAAIAIVSCVFGFVTGRFAQPAASPEQAQQPEAGVAQRDVENGPQQSQADRPAVARVTPLSFTPAAARQQVAIITQIEGQASSAFQVGERLCGGVLELQTGSIQLEFVSGAVVALQGPASLQLRSPMSATLITGAASVRVPDRARGFVLNAPHVAIVDLGTEFSVEIEADGTPRVDVREGLVEVSLVGDDGNTLSSRRVEANMSVRVDRLLRRLSDENRRNSPVPRVSPVVVPRLSVPMAYRESVRQLSPMLYWTFDRVSDGVTVDDESGDNTNAIAGVVSDPGVIDFESDYARFHGSDSARTIVTTHSLPRFNESDYSIEFWVNMDSLVHSALVSIAPATDLIPWNHLCLIELANQTTHVHKPGSIRFLHRFPPAQLFELGTNLYSNGDAKPGVWQHVVAVKSKTALRLFVDGQLVSEAELEHLPDADDYVLYLGQLRRQGYERQFIGGIDELAVYKQALTREVVREHYDLLRVDAQR